MIFNFFNKFKQSINRIKAKKKLLDSLIPGNLVWAKMPLSKKELKTIPESHQTRPYLIVHTDFFFAYAYQSSSKQNNNLNNCEEYRINKLRYNQKKNSFINFTKVHKIPFINLKSKFLTLNQLDLKNIQKRINIKTDNKSKYQPLTDIYITDGDVIEIDNQLYYVYACDNVYLYCLIIFKKCPKVKKKKYKNITINNKTYYTTFKETFSFERTTKMNIINIAYKTEVKEILDKKNGFTINEKHLSNKQKKNIERDYDLAYESGTVFKIGKSKIVYLFKYKKVHYGVDLLMYTIKPKAIPIFDIETKPILEILKPDDFLKIVEFLCLKNVHPLPEIKELYDELRDVVYK